MANCDNLEFSRLNGEEADKLEVPFTEEEIGAALKELNGDKDPRPDSLTTTSWQFN